MIPSALPRSRWERDDGTVDAAAALNDLKASLSVALVADAEGDLWIPAAVRPAVEGAADPTHYDAVWVRDAVWGYWALKDEGRVDEARRVLRKLSRYYASPPQRARFEALLENPRLLQGPDGAMAVPHIRFDGGSPSMADVHVTGHPQRWNHKQNDALALFFAAMMDAVENGDVSWPALPIAEQKALLLFPAYWYAVDFATMEDSGAWEEVERCNSSSVGLVTWALERAEKVLGTVAPIAIDRAQLRSSIENGYKTLRKQLPFESPDYGKKDVHYREADAALLALVYPARLQRFTAEMSDALLEQVGRLVRPAGVLRYEGDAYQCAGYWTGSADAAHESRTDDCSRPEDFAARSAGRPAGGEAEWFFDSWLALAFLRRGNRSRAEAHVARALRQCTGAGAVGADGKPVPANAFPESYNVVFDGAERRYVPSPITPLNWAKASLALALRELTRR